ncbi:MAG: hypothetical protein F6K11_35265 [Leptolyngbya sp. SIO3F4]|nr:hypothetical protein [Leptolyngbya sp. SIO3F4]
MLLPFVILGGIGWGLYKFWQYRKQQQQQLAAIAQEKQDELLSVFYTLTEQHRGRMSVFDFAMKAKVTVPEARNFLDEKAKEFCAEFDVTESGKVLYVFNDLEPEYSKQIAEDLRLESTQQVIEVEPDKQQVDQSISLTQAELARRLSLSSSSVGRKKFSPDFAQWSQARDPQGWVWSYDVTQKRFHPFKG